MYRSRMLIINLSIYSFEGQRTNLTHSTEHGIKIYIIDFLWIKKNKKNIAIVQDFII